MGMLKKSFKMINDLAKNKIMLFDKVRKFCRAILLPQMRWLEDRNNCPYWMI